MCCVLQNDLIFEGIGFRLLFDSFGEGDCEDGLLHRKALARIEILVKTEWSVLQALRLTQSI